MSISNEKLRALQARMARLKVKEPDIEEKFVRSSGRGGQNVNKVSTCVYLKHLPTGLEVKCQRERSQALNRFLARRLLLDKIEEREEGLRSARQQKIEKIRRQKRRRSRRAKEKMLRDKQFQATKKKLRGRPAPDEP